jgi:hypothetical protein
MLRSGGRYARPLRRNILLSSAKLNELSFVSTFNAGLVSKMSFPSRQGRQEYHLRVSGAFYNTRWLHSALGHRGRADSEEGRMGDAKVA